VQPPEPAKVQAGSERDAVTTLLETRPVSVAILPAVPLPEYRRLAQIPARDWTVADVVAATEIDPAALAVSLDGQIIAPDEWRTTVPTGGQSLIVSQRPGVITGAIAIGVAVTNVIGAASLGIIATTAIISAVALAVTAAFVYGVSLLMQALMPPGESPNDESTPGVRRTITGGHNYFDAYAPVPQVLGKHRFFPLHAARQYTTVEGGKLYQHALFTFGYGKLDISELKIGDEPLMTSDASLYYTGSFFANTDAFGGRVVNGTRVDGNVVQMEMRAGTSTDAAHTLFATNVQETIVAKRLRYSAGWGNAVTQTTIERATNITIIVGCPQGLIWRDTTKNKRATVRMGWRYRAVGATTWTTPAGGELIKMTDQTASSVYTKRSVSVIEGTYEVQVRRISNPGGTLGISDVTDWASMLVTRAGTVHNLSNLCTVAMKVKITGEFSRLIDSFNAVVQTNILNYDNGSSWVQGPTSNPAALYRHVLQGDANKRPVADGAINLTNLQTWSADCITNGFEFNTVTQGRSTVRDILRQIAGAGFASPAMQDGLHSVVMANDLSGAPVQHFTPRNVIAFHSERAYITKPEAFKVQFVDPESGWLDTQAIVPDDGFTPTTATTFELLDMPGITSHSQAYKLGRRHLAQLRLRPEKYIVETTFEHLDCIRGDWVKFAHDVVLQGLAQGRVLSTTLNGGGDVLTATLDQACPMAAASYACRFRKSNGATVYALVDTDAGNQTTITFTTPIDSASVPEAGDLFLFGVAGTESVDLIVQEIEPTGDLGARLTLVDAAPGVLTASTSTIPAYSPQITIPPVIQPPALNPPRVLSATSSSLRERNGGAGSVRRGVRVRFQSPGVAV